MLQSMELQRDGHDLAVEQLNSNNIHPFLIHSPVHPSGCIGNVNSMKPLSASLCLSRSPSAGYGVFCDNTGLQLWWFISLARLWAIGRLTLCCISLCPSCTWQQALAQINYLGNVRCFED